MLQHKCADLKKAVKRFEGYNIWIKLYEPLFEIKRMPSLYLNTSVKIKVINSKKRKDMQTSGRTITKICHWHQNKMLDKIQDTQTKSKMIFS